MKDKKKERKLSPGGKALPESEEKYRQLVEGSLQGICIAQGIPPVIVFTNPALAEILGYTVDEILSLTPEGTEKLIHPEDRAIFFQRYRDRLEGKPAIQRYEIRALRKDGSVRLVEMLSSPVNYQDQPAVQATFQDITERKRAEDQILIANERLQYLLTSSTAVIYTAKISGNYGAIYLTDNIILLTGYNSIEFIENSNFWSEHVHPEDLPRILGELPGIFEKEYHAYDYRFLHKNGHYFWVHDEMKLIKDKEGNPLEIVGYLTDITERKKAEQALLESEKKYRRIIDHSLLGFYIIQNQILKFCNQRLAKIFGYEKSDELLGMHIRELIAPESWATVEPFVRLKESGELDEVSNEFKGKKKDGKVIDLEVLGGRILYDGKSAIQGSMIDVTERKHLEAQLLQSQKMEAVGRLAGGVAHDFNNLLTTIMGYSELLSQTLQSGDPSRDYVECVLNSARRGANLTNQLLALSRRHAVQEEVLNLNTVVADTNEILKRLIGEHIEMITMLDPSLEHVKADPVQIEQILMNLAVNARDAMPQGGQLTIRTANAFLNKAYCCRYKEVVPGHYIMLSVSDTGHGMDTEVQSHLFEPFFTTKEKEKGTGLGLSTVYGIIKQSSGHIEVESAPGKGSTFNIYLPRVEEIPQSHKPAAAHAELPHGTETILVVEDEEKVRALIATVLHNMGYTVLEGCNGEEALRIAKQHQDPIHLLLTDVIMPRLSGIDLANLLLAQRPEMKILFISGYTDGELASYGGMTSEMPLLQKPFRTEILARRVRDVLDAP